MISRYDVFDISSLWNEESRFKYYLHVEIAHLRTLEEEGLVPKGTADTIAGAKIVPKRISEIEMVTNHDVIAFCTSITEQYPAEIGRFFHFGITSSDVIDTAHALLIKDSMAVIEKDLIELKTSLRKQAEATSGLLCIGRSHGISAEAMIFGQKFLSFEAEMGRRITQWKEAASTLTGQLSGAVGNYTVVTPEQEEKTLKRLGLNVETVSSQIIPRDHYAKVVSIGALIASAFERMAIEFRLLQHSDIDEVSEGFSRGQKGSSTMPHKKNPISSENITGLSRILRSHIIPALENCSLWHERDISHSSVERMMLPDHFGLLAYCSRRMKNVIENLVINHEKIESKVKSSEKIYSSYILHKLIQMNMTTKREDLYEVVQGAFFKANNQNELKKILEEELDAKNLKHEVSQWINFENLRAHYQSQFAKVLKRDTFIQTHSNLVLK
jgi:adenylosuccinate lyase